MLVEKRPQLIGGEDRLRNKAVFIMLVMIEVAGVRIAAPAVEGSRWGSGRRHGGRGRQPFGFGGWPGRQ